MRYVFIYKKNVDKFENKLEVLKAKRTSVQLEVDVADRKGEKIKPDVELWCKTVDKVINEDVKKMKDLEDKAKNNFKSRYQISKKAEEGVAAVDDLIQQYCQFNGAGYRDVLEAPKCAASKNYKAFDLRKEVLDGVIEVLKDSAISTVGVYGTGGVGKSTLVNQVTVQVEEDNLFDWVVKTTKEKKILIVLDDIWARLDLEEVGIPFGDQHEGCKILLTSRNQDLLINEIGVKNTFAIDVLNETEAWDLFKEMVENNFEDLELRSVATEVTKKCEGLPVARALKSKDMYAWKDASLKLQSPSPSSFTGIPATLYSAIKLSYNSLEVRNTDRLSCFAVY
ncbi:PREDICTED: probable disease resistance protein At5g63020 [Theobroma cacao]|uniref:Probable disease resistance protein At5g63020 n=1 Tax=Theobroma cacao TaxID=3641 RepID=A0AB32VV96_THECC|nr:PREDICTED: probable disease resistance protein At5g63020 [Theobroma cacao]